MRLGLLGPVPAERSASLEAAAEFLLQGQKVARAIYLGDDDALDRVVQERATRLFGGDPSDDGVWRRAAELTVDGDPDEINAFIAAERERRKLKVLESLPRPALRTIEMVGDRITVLIFDKSLLDEEDIFPASLLVYGKGEGHFAKRIGNRWFLSPGKLDAIGGVCVLEDSGEDLVARFYNDTGRQLGEERMPSAGALKLKVQGGA